MFAIVLEAYAPDPAGYPVSRSVVVKGGTFNYEHTTNIADGFKVVDNGNGTWSVEFIKKGCIKQPFLLV